MTYLSPSFQQQFASNDIPWTCHKIVGIILRYSYFQKIYFAFKDAFITHILAISFRFWNFIRWIYSFPNNFVLIGQRIYIFIACTCLPTSLPKSLFYDSFDSWKRSTMVSCNPHLTRVITIVSDFHRRVFKGWDLIW